MVEEGHHRFSKDYVMDGFFDTLDLFNTASTAAAAAAAAVAPSTATVPPPSQLFISDSDFAQLVEERRVSEEAIDWADLPVDIVYFVHSMLPIKTKWGAQVILGLRNKDGGEVKVWTPTNVSKELKTGIKLNSNNSSNVYIKSLGQKETKTSTGGRKRYFDFDAVYL